MMIPTSNSDVLTEPLLSSDPRGASSSSSSSTALPQGRRPPPRRVPKPPEAVYRLLDLSHNSMVAREYHDWAGEWLDLQLPMPVVDPIPYLVLRYDMEVYQLLSLRSWGPRKTNRNKTTTTNSFTESFTCIFSPECRHRMVLEGTFAASSSSDNKSVRDATAVTHELRRHSCRACQQWTTRDARLSLFQAQWVRGGNNNLNLGRALATAYLLERPDLLAKPSRQVRAAVEKDVTGKLKNYVWWDLYRSVQWYRKHHCESGDDQSCSVPCVFEIWALFFVKPPADCLESAATLVANVCDWHLILMVFLPGLIFQMLFLTVLPFVLPVGFALLYQSLYGLPAREKTYRLYEREGMQVNGRILRYEYSWWGVPRPIVAWQVPAQEGATVRTIRTQPLLLLADQSGVGDDLPIYILPSVPTSRIYLKDAVNTRGSFLYGTCSRVFLGLLGLGISVADCIALHRYAFGGDEDYYIFFLFLGGVRMGALFGMLIAEALVVAFSS